MSATTPRSGGGRSLARSAGWFRGMGAVRRRASPSRSAAGEAFRERFRYGIPGYDPEYEEYRVGDYVMMRLNDR